MEKDFQKILLETARDAVRAAVNKLPPKVPHTDNPELNQHQGCFVTLKNQHMLRGCIGQFTSDKPLIQLVAEMAVAPATRDPRFFADQITPEELDSLNIEISVLSPMEKTADPLPLRLTQW